MAQIDPCGLTTPVCNNPLYLAPDYYNLIWMRVMNWLVGSGTPISEATLLEAAESYGLNCKSIPDLRALQLSMICQLRSMDCAPSVCLSPQQVEAIKTYLLCLLINPPVT